MFLLLADLYKFTGQTEARATALRNALEASGEDPALKAAVSEADREIARMNMKLSELPVFSPSSDDEVAFCARIDILNSYGFPDRALTAIDEALVTLPHATCLIARGVELLINLKRVDDAVQRLRDAVEWTRGQARQAFADRLAQLGGPKLVFDEVEPGDLLPELEGDALEDMELIDDDELIDDEAEAPAPSRRPATVVPTPTRTTAPSPRPPASLPSSSPPDGVFALGKRLLEEGRLDDAAVAFQDAYREDPTNEEVLLYIGRVRGMQREARAQPRPLVESGPAPRVVEAPSVPPMTTAPPSDPPRRQAASLTVPAADEFDFSRLLSAEAEVGGLGIDDEPRSASADAEHSLVEEALSLESVGAFDEAVAVLEPVNTLPARLIVARCLGSLGRHEDGVSCLRQALELHEGDPAWPDALFELASLQVKAGRIRQALSLLEELRDDFPSYRPSEIATRLRGLARLLSRPT
jgi:tetratricopeptide (TPR) repeat protein